MNRHLFIYWKQLCQSICAICTACFSSFCRICDGSTGSGTQLFLFFSHLLLPSCFFIVTLLISVLWYVYLKDYTAVHNGNAVRTRIRKGGYHEWWWCWYPCCQIFISSWWSWSQTNTKKSPDNTHHFSCEFFFCIPSLLLDDDVTQFMEPSLKGISMLKWRIE